MATLKTPQILRITPASEILFEGPFEQVVTSYLELENPSEQKVCFKVKTTAPKRYCVRPNSGIVEPGGKVKIAIMLQPIEEDSQSERSKHKFMVQSTIIHAADNSNLESVWINAENIMDSKLRCVFQTPIPKATATEATSTTSKTITTNTSTTVQSPQVTVPQKYAGDGRSSISRPSPTSHEHTGYGHDTTMEPSSQSLLIPMRDDYKLVLVSLAMMFIGVILGKYII